MDFVLDPPVTGRYVSVNINGTEAPSRRPRNIIQLTEVMVEEVRGTETETSTGSSGKRVCSKDINCV